MTIQDEQTTQTASNNASSSKVKNTNKGALLLSSLALCIAIIGCGGSVAWNYWKEQQQKTQQNTQSSALTEQLTEQLTTQKNQEAQLKKQIAQMEQDIQLLTTQTSTLQNAQHKLNEQLTKVATTPSSTKWSLFEAKQLLKQAFLRLRVGDINGTVGFLEDIKTIITKQNSLSQSAATIIQEIERALLTLKQTEQVNKALIYSELSALKQQIATLNPKQNQFDNVIDLSTNQPEGRWEKLSNKLSSYVKVDFNANSKTLPLINTQDIGRIKISLDLALEKAQWAALNGEAVVYKEELTQTANLLNHYFDTNAVATKTLLDQITTLQNKTIKAHIPDISKTLQDVNQYLNTQITPQLTTTPVTTEDEAQ